MMYFKDKAAEGCRPSAENAGFNQELSREEIEDGRSAESL
jgi:hypothetical protein